MFSPWVIAGWVVTGLIGGRMFAYRGYYPLIGIMIGVLLGPIWLVYCWFLPMTPAARRAAAADKEAAALTETGAASKTCPGCGRPCGGVATFCPRCNHHFPTTA